MLVNSFLATGAWLVHWSRSASRRGHWHRPRLAALHWPSGSIAVARL